MVFCSAVLTGAKSLVVKNFDFVDRVIGECRSVGPLLICNSWGCGDIVVRGNVLNTAEDKSKCS
jgi:hypothetical protein